MYPFREGCFAPRNGWYVAAFANEVGREPLGRWILNEPIAMFRPTDGEDAIVTREIEDMPASLGFAPPRMCQSNIRGAAS